MRGWTTVEGGDYRVDDLAPVELGCRAQFGDGIDTRF
jgi:hypothetical protein